MATVESRITLLEQGRDDFEILNPRTWDTTPEHEAANRERVEQARRSGKRIIVIPSPRNFGE